MSDLLTPDRTIILPESVYRRAKGRCLGCNRPFSEAEMRPGGPYERHVAHCHEDPASYQDRSVRTKMPELFGYPDGTQQDGVRGHSFDGEQELWIQRHRLEIIEGRRKM